MYGGIKVGIEELERMDIDDIATTIDWLRNQKQREEDAINNR